MLHKHYLLPKELEYEFKEAKPHGIPIDPDDFIVEVEMEHLDYPDFMSFQAAWLQSWRRFFARNKRPSVNLFFGYCDTMARIFKIDQNIKSDESTT
jgi:hypothetical protein